MSELAFKGDYGRIVWSEYGDGPCSYCGAQIPDDSVPLRLWKQGGDLGAQFCDRCANVCFGLQFEADNE